MSGFDAVLAPPLPPGLAFGAGGTGGLVVSNDHDAPAVFGGIAGPGGPGGEPGGLPGTGSAAGRDAAGAAPGGAFGSAGSGPAAGGGGPGVWGDPGEAGRVLDFRRRGAPPRRRRRSPLLALVRPLGVAVLTVALPLGLASWVLTSRRFQLRGIAVTGTQRVPAVWVRQALGPLDGRNLLRLPLTEVRERLAANPWIATADVAKELPDRLRVTVTERRPAVLLRGPGGALLFADGAGQPIAPVGSPAEQIAARRQGLLVVSFPRPLPGAVLARPAALGAGAGAAREAAETAAASGLPAGVVAAESQGVVDGALRLAAQLRQLRPAWAPALAEIEAVDDDDYLLRIETLPCPLLVRGSRLAGNLDRFEELLPELRRRYPALARVDLRSARRIVIQPAAAPAPGASALPPAPPAIPRGAPAVPPVSTVPSKPPGAGAPTAPGAGG